MHILNSRRRGKTIPVGVPLHIKEKFLKDETRSNLYTRPAQSTLKLTIDSYQLETNVEPASADQVEALKSTLNSILEEKELLKAEFDQINDQTSEMQLISTELNGLIEYKQKYLNALSAALNSTNPFDSHDSSYLLKEIEAKLAKRVKEL